MRLWLDWYQVVFCFGRADANKFNTDDGIHQEFFVSLFNLFRIYMKHILRTSSWILVICWQYLLVLSSHISSFFWSTWRVFSPYFSSVFWSTWRAPSVRSQYVAELFGFTRGAFVRAFQHIFGLCWFLVSSCIFWCAPRDLQGSRKVSSLVPHRRCSTHGRSRRRRKGSKEGMKEGKKDGRIIHVSPDLVWAQFDALAAICRGLNGGVPHFGPPRMSWFLCC